MMHSAPVVRPMAGLAMAMKAALGKALLATGHAHDEDSITVARDALADVMTTLRDVHEYQQLMEIAGVDYPGRADRFEVVYHLLSITRNHRLRVRVTAGEADPVPSITAIWPNAGWLEREIFDLYGVVFSGNGDLRRILTDYGFDGHPFRKDFPLTGYVELRYSEEEKRVVYEPVKLAQDFRSFDFLSPWEGAEYVLPGDEKAPPPPPPPPPAAAKVTEKPAEPAPKAPAKPRKPAAKKPAARKAAPKQADKP